MDEAIALLLTSLPVASNAANSSGLLKTDPSTRAGGMLRQKCSIAYSTMLESTPHPCDLQCKTARETAIACKPASSPRGFALFYSSAFSYTRSSLATTLSANMTL